MNLVAAPAVAQALAPVRSVVLENGLTVLVLEEHTAPIASVWCWYKVGSKDEHRGLTGVSHWVEHMNFRGTTNIPRDRVKGLIEKYGGSWNGYTWIDQTTYLETATRDALDLMLFIESERMARCLYDPEDCEAERTIIISELQGGENDPDQLLDQELTATAFKAHTYQHPTIGWLSDLQSMTRDDLYGHYRRFYIPNNATLVVVGDVDTEATLGMVDRHFRSIPAGPVPARIRTREPEQTGERRLVLRKPGTTAYLKLGYHAPSVTDPDFFPGLVLDAVLTGAKGINLWSSFRMPAPQRRSRLYRALVDTGLASAVSGALLPTEQPFLYTLSATISTGTPIERVLEALLREVDTVCRDGITTSELQTAVTQLKARLVFDDDSVTSVAHQLGYFQTIASADLFLGASAQIDAVSLEAVHAVARRMLVASNRTVGWFDPES